MGDRMDTRIPSRVIALDPGSNRIATRALWYMYGASNTDAIAQFLNAQIPGAEPLTLQLTSGLVPAHAIVRAGATMLVFIAGTETFRQGYEQAYGWGQPTQIGPRQWINTAVNGAVNTLFPVIRGLMGPRWGEGRVILYGHSYGGSIADALCPVLRQDYPRAEIVQITYGAPRAFAGPGAGWAPRIYRLRFAGARDAIPSLPADNLHLPLVASGLPGSLEKIHREFRHHSQAFFIQRGFPQLRGAFSRLAEGTTKADMLQWGLYGFGPVGRAHSILTYSEYFREAETARWK